MVRCFIPDTAAFGWTSLAIRINIIAVAIIVPAIIWITPRYGGVGAAWVWLAQPRVRLDRNPPNAPSLLQSEKLRWHMQDVVAPLGAATFSAAMIAWIWPEIEGVIADLSQLMLVAITTLITALGPQIELSESSVWLATPIFLK